MPRIYIVEADPQAAVPYRAVEMEWEGVDRVALVVRDAHSQALNDAIVSAGLEDTCRLYNADLTDFAEVLERGSAVRQMRRLDAAEQRGATKAELVDLITTHRARGDV